MTTSLKTFEPARIVGTDLLRVEYYVIDPSSGRKVRKRVRISSKLSKKERFAHARLLAEHINRNLAAGWNPFRSELPSTIDTPLVEVVNSYIRSCELDMRPNSLRSYRSYCNRLVTFLKLSKREACTVSQFLERDAIRLMDRIAATNATKQRTYNNYLMAYRRLWNWMIEHKHTDVNVFEIVKPKRLSPKYRESIDPQTRAELANYLREYDWRFMVICELVYFCLLRPNEIVQLKPRMIDFTNQVIVIPADVSKNKKEQYVTIPDVLVGDLRHLIDQAPCRQNEYLFSDGKYLTPGRFMLNPRSLSKRWARLRRKLNLPLEYQLYSLKDAGITDLILAGIPANEVMYQARHHSLEVTSVYIKRAKRSASDHIRAGLSAF